MAPDPVNPTLKSLLPGAFQPNNLQTQQPQISPLTTLRSLSTPVDMGAPAMPQLPPAPMPTLPQAGLRPLVTNPQQQQMQRQMDEYAKMANVHQGLTHSGAPAHGFWQHLAKIAEGAGNVAGDVFAPGVEANIPGSQLYRAQEAQAGAQGEKGLRQEEMQEQNAASSRNLQGQQAAGIAEQTAEAPGKAQSEESLQGAQAYRQRHPLATSDFELWHQQNPNGTAEDYQRMTQKPLTQEEADARNAVWDKIAAQYHLPTGQFKAGMTGADASALAGSLNNVISRGQGGQNITIREQQLSEKVPMIAPNGKGGYTLQYIQPGQSITPGSMTPNQGGSVNAPTNTERTAAGRAEIVHGELPSLIANIQKNADALGPVMGRWNDFMQGKVGNENPEFAQLRANLLMASSAVALAHAQGRLPENLREEFDKAINAPQQSPENLVAILQAIDPWMEQMAKLGTVPGISPAGGGNTGAPKAGEVDNGYRFNGGDPSDQKNWVKQ